MADGWISIHRSLINNWVWEDKPFDRGRAWVDLILMANWKDNKFLLGNELMMVERGSFITSELKLMDRWGWGKEKTRKFLKLLESDGMIIKKADRKKTTITIVNYSVYQPLSNDNQTTDRPQTDHRQTTDRPQTDTNNKDNKENKEKKDNNGSKPNGFSVIIDSYTNDENLKQSIIDFVDMRKKNKKNMTERALELMLKKLDGLAGNEVDKKLILNQSIENCWQGIFPLKNNGNQQQLKQQSITNNPFLEMAMNGEFDDE